jgi:alkanesulfonate monooxygenase SsuD/methylene tetrahydromethanopterin reductase-like flavin-dependent oxidoreductase (luciferase family)
VLPLLHYAPALASSPSWSSPRRLILVLGGGGPMNEPAYRALGLESRSPGEKVEALAEAIEILRGLWSTSGFSYPGKHFRTEGATIEPKPAHAIPIWLGVFGDRMLELVGRKADGWLPTYQFLAPEQAYRKLERLRRAAEHAGRNPDLLTYGYTIPVLVEKGGVTTGGQIVGSAQEVARQLAEVVRHGFTFLNLWPAGEATTQRELLAREVLPIVRDLTV